MRPPSFQNFRLAAFRVAAVACRLETWKAGKLTIYMPILVPLPRTPAASKQCPSRPSGRKVAFERQLLDSNVVSRESTGGELFVDLEVAPSADAVHKKTAAFGDNVWIGIDAMKLSLGMILHFEDGRASLLKPMRLA
jgi:hypothetical protein